MLWVGSAGLLLAMVNAAMRMVALELDPFQTQFLRFLFGLVVMLPFVLRVGFRAYCPRELPGQLGRGVVQTAGQLLWFLALPHVPLAETTAIDFTGPIFVMAGAALFLCAPVGRARWAAAAVRLAGVLVVVGPRLSGEGGWYNLAMLASAPLFAASYLVAKTLTRRDPPEVIVVWQALTVCLFTLPLALPAWTWPSPAQYGWFLLCGFLGSVAHYGFSEAFRLADVSATQPLRFLEFVWAAALGFLLLATCPPGRRCSARS